jgi:transcriptional regulator with XRE-family HTH domain
MSASRIPQNSPTAFVRALGAAVRARRLRLGQTRADLSGRSGLSESVIARVEAGDATLDLLQLVAIAEALEIALRTLLRQAERAIGWTKETASRGTGREAGVAARTSRKRRKKPDQS